MDILRSHRLLSRKEAAEFLGVKENKPWRLEAVSGGYMTHAVMQSGRAYYHWGRDCYPGSFHEIYLNYNYGYSGRKPGPNRVN